MPTVPQTAYSVTYNNRNITSDISRFLLSLSYSDKTQGETDEISIELEDVDHLWQNNWYPEKGANLAVTIGSLNCGTFQIDEIELQGPPSTVTIRGIAIGITNSLRTRRSDAHENKTLKQIAEKIATKNNLTIEGEIPDITLSRTTQNKETDVAFLKRISAAYGIIFSVRGSVITFTSVFGLEQRGASFVLDKTNISRYSIKDKADGMVKSAQVKSKNSKKNEAVSVNLDFEKYKQDNPAYTAPPTENQNDGVAYPYAENQQQGEAIAKAIMHLSASNQQEGNLTMQFNPLAVAGNNFTLTGLGLLSGKYNIKSSSHKIDRSGAVTEIEIKRLQTPTKQQQVTVKPKRQQASNVPVNQRSVSGVLTFDTGIPDVFI